MSEMLLKNSPVASLRLALQREAQRALEAQHLPVDDRQTLQTLLAARALPLVLDLLLLDGSEWDLSLLEFDGVDVKIHRQPEQDALLAFAEHKVGSHSVCIFFVEKDRALSDEPSPEQQKPEQQKPEQQKPEHQKPEHQKPEHQKPEQQKPEDQSPEQARVDPNVAFAAVQFFLTERSVDEAVQDTVIIRRFSFNAPHEPTRPGRG
ncbi:MAG: hypothetical protein GY822_18855 [Deltaproteobacteria bacterium]|nr:hypothetical protein [Deltaproteobacteria bacterium]